MKTKVYLAGKVTGEDYQECWDKFEFFEELLNVGGYEVINPMRIVPKGTHSDEAMEILKPHFIGCNYAFFMGDWTQSPGARTEMEWAKIYHKPIIFHYELDGFIRSDLSCLAPSSQS